MIVEMEKKEQLSNNVLFGRLPIDQRNRVFASDLCDIDSEFLGFVWIYERLSEIIPKHWTVVDLGCAYAPQCFFFEEHAKYIGVDIHEVEARFCAENTKHYKMPIIDFVNNCDAEFNIDTTFAICSYVPPWGGDNMSAARNGFKNVFTFYPAGGAVIIPRRLA